MNLEASLLAAHDLATRRSVLDLRERERGPLELARGLDEVWQGARAGSARAREASVAIASWIAHRRGDSVVAVAAATAGLELAAPILSGGPATSALPPGGRLAEVAMASRRSLAVPQLFSQRRFFVAGWGFHLREQLLRHHDPIMIERLLDEPWLRLGDALVIASRRPSIPPFFWAMATRDRWFGRARVREALAANPFAPAELVLALLPSLSAASLRVLRRGRPGVVQRAARLFR